VLVCIPTYNEAENLPGISRAILDQLAAAALDRAAALAEVELALSDQAALSRVMARLITGRAKVTGRWS